MLVPVSTPATATDGTAGVLHGPRTWPANVIGVLIGAGNPVGLSQLFRM